MAKGDGHISQQPESKGEGRQSADQVRNLGPENQVGQLPHVGKPGADAMTFAQNGMASKEQLLGPQTPAEAAETLAKFGKPIVVALNEMGLTSDSYKALLGAGVSPGAIKELVSAGVSGGFLGAFAKQFSSVGDMTKASDPAMRASASMLDSEVAAKKVTDIIKSKDLSALLPVHDKAIERASQIVQRAEANLLAYQTKFKKELGST